MNDGEIEMSEGACVTEYNRRQFKLMLTMLREPNVHKIFRLGFVSVQVEALLDALDGVDDELDYKLRKQCGILDEVYAYALYKNLPNLTSEVILLVDTAVSTLKSIVEIELAEDVA